MEPIRIDRFRSVHHDGRVTLTAELSSQPTPHWRRLCDSNFTRYYEAFGEQPALVGATVVVATSTGGLGTSQMALESVVKATNERCFGGLVGSS